MFLRIHNSFATPSHCLRNSLTTPSKRPHSHWGASSERRNPGAQLKELAKRKSCERVAEELQWRCERAAMII